MSRTSARLWMGNGALLLALAGLAGWLGSLHAGIWWSTPAPARWQWASVAVLLYAALCVAVLARRRKQHGAEGGSDGVLIVWASQTGFARELAERSANALQAAGVAAHTLPLEAVDTDRLAHVSRLLCILSTSGEGDAPDHAQAVSARGLNRLPARLLARGLALLNGSGDHASTSRAAVMAFLIRVVSAGIAYLSQVLLARWMGSFEYGVFVFVWVWVLILGGLAPLGRPRA